MMVVVMRIRLVVKFKNKTQVKQQKESHEGDDNPKLKKINSRKKKYKYARRKWLVPSAKGIPFNLKKKTAEIKVY